MNAKLSAKPGALCAGWLLLPLLALLLSGCSSANVNPASPHAKTGYIDFYTDSDLDLSWDVKRIDQASGKKHDLFSEFKPIDGNILRLAVTPGNYQYEIWFINLATRGPQTVKVQVADGEITPVHVTLTASGVASFDVKDYRFGGSAKRYGRGTKIHTEQNQVFQIAAAAAAPQPYQPKAKMPYFATPEKQEPAKAGS